MDLKTVRSYASEGGVGLDGVKVRIIRDESLVGKDLYGYCIYHETGLMVRKHKRKRFADVERQVKVPV
jgi:hypothetical protein